MKKYIAFSLILFISFCYPILGASEKDFCVEEDEDRQDYCMDCQDIEVQCNYISPATNVTANVDIGKKGSGICAFVNNSISDEETVQNWGRTILGFSDVKKQYLNDGKCPKWLIFADVDGANDDVYLCNSDSDCITSSSDLCKNGECDDDDIDIFKYTGMSINTRVKNSVSEDVQINENAPDVDSCAGFKKKNACINGVTKFSGNFGCAWNKDYKFCSPTGLAYLSCGSKTSKAYDIPVMVPRLSSYAITALKTITPVILIIMGMFQLIKAITSQNEDKMKKARSSLIKKLIAATMIFFLVAIVQFIVKQVADDSEQSSLESCLNCFVNNNCSNAMYYTDGYGNCYSVKTKKKLKSCPVSNY